MINIDEINEEIAKLENKPYLTYDICNKLSVLYTIRNNYKPSPNKNTSLTSMELDMNKTNKSLS